ncbi:MAG TPA: ATP-binding protein [Candidatus Binatia bacterium]|jgi:two-component system NtrC family sensor kinase
MASTPRSGFQQSIAQQVKNAHVKLAVLLASAQAIPPLPEQQQLLSEALAELSVALEELHATSEEMHAQNEELAATRNEVENQRRNYQSLFDQAPDAYFVTDVAGVIQQANRKASALLHLGEKFLHGKPLALFFPPEHRPAYRRLMLKLARSDALPETEFEMHFQPRKGHPFPAAVAVSVVRQSQASGWRPIGLRWIVRDTSERKQVERQIESHVQRLTVVGALNEAITAQLDLDKVVSVLFTKLEEFFAYPIVITLRLFHPETGDLEPLFSRNIDDAEWKSAGIHTPGDRAAEVIHTRTPLVILDLEADPRSVRREFYKKHRLVSCVTVPVIAKDEVLGIISLYTKERREFTGEELQLLAAVGQQTAIAIQNSRLYEETKQQAAELAAARDELEDKVSLRTVELERSNDMLRAEIVERQRIEERLRESEAKLRALTEEQEQQLIASDRLVTVGELAASIAHEFNNPLQIIMGFAQELLEEEKTAGPHKDGLKIIEGETMRCRELIRNLMNFAQPLPAKPETREVEPIVADSVKLAWHYLLNNKVRVKTDIGRGLPPIRADANQLQQVLINLMFNASEAMPSGGEVTIRAARGHADTVVISVSDTGVGISETALPNIFRPFFTTKQKRGMGLGLSICERIVRAHGGRIAVDTAPGRGTTFELHFPLAEVTDYEERAS